MFCLVQIMYTSGDSGRASESLHLLFKPFHSAELWFYMSEGYMRFMYLPH